MIFLIFRELSKLCMIVFFWTFPIYLALKNDNSNFLWLFVISFFCMLGTFDHYEKLDSPKTDFEDEKKEKDNE